MLDVAWYAWNILESWCNRTSIARYVAPEVILGTVKPHQVHRTFNQPISDQKRLRRDGPFWRCQAFALDFWALGCIIYLAWCWDFQEGWLYLEHPPQVLLQKSGAFAGSGMTVMYVCMYLYIYIYIYHIYIYIWIWLRCMEHLAVAAARCLSERLHSMLNQSQGLRLAIISIHSARLICVDEMGQHTPTMAIECILVLWCKTSDFGVFNFQTYKTMHKKTSAFVSLICLFSWRHCRTCNNQIVQKLPSFVYLSMMNDPHELPHGVVALMQMNPLGTWCSSGSRMLTTSSLRTWIGRCHQIQLLPELSIVDEQPLLGQAQMLTEAAGPMVRENIGGRDFNWIQPDGSKRIPKVGWPIESMFRWFTTNFREHRMAKIYMVEYG